MIQNVSMVRPSSRCPLDSRNVAAVEARHRGLLHPMVAHGWYDKHEPIGWLADAIAEATLEHLRGTAAALQPVMSSAAWFDLSYTHEPGT